MIIDGKRGGTAACAILALLLVSSCSGDTPPAAADRGGTETDSVTGALCEYRDRRSDTVLQAFKDITGATWWGEIDHEVGTMRGKWPGQRGGRVFATAVARPKVDMYRVRRSANCFDEKTRSYYTCTRTEEVDFSQIRGFARAPTMTEAEDYARLLCQEKVLDIATKATAVRQQSWDLTCEVVASLRCPAPAEPAK